MKVTGKALILLLALSVLMLAVTGYAQEERKIKKADYKLQLADWQGRDAAANEKVVTLETEIATLKKDLDTTQGSVDATWSQIYTALGATASDVDAYRQNLNTVDGNIDGLAVLSPEDLFRRSEEVDALCAEIAKLKESKISNLTEMENKLAELDGKLAALKAKVPANIFDQYTVVEGDYLWKISKNEDIYGDPFQWIRIYNVNKDQIKDPDLIYKEQVFNIARGVARNEHLVAKGEFLYSIAGMAKVLGDPTKWTTLFEANKDIITDPNLIYPYQVLTVPKQ
ncbi:LysM peptidoglycan-binding domain-containing protein [bacterium]|nr:LysM peptidoglycan-binding domain-containing protein [bacterium]